MRISDITIDTKLNRSRLGQLDLVIVADYAEAMQRGDVFPPVACFENGMAIYLADGFHRIAAAKQIGLTEIEADVRKGSWYAALLYASTEANRSHGLQVTREGKRARVLAVFEAMPEMKRLGELTADLSDREIARQCGVSQPYVGKLREENHTDNVISMNTNRTFIHHKTGKPAVMDTANIGKGQPTATPQALGRVNREEAPLLTEKPDADCDAKFEALPAKANYQEGDFAYCKYCYNRHDNWCTGDDYGDELVWKCLICNHATHDKFMKIIGKPLPDDFPDENEAKNNVEKSPVSQDDFIQITDANGEVVKARWLNEAAVETENGEIFFNRESVAAVIAEAQRNPGPIAEWSRLVSQIATFRAKFETVSLIKLLIESEKDLSSAYQCLDYFEEIVARIESEVKL